MKVSTGKIHTIMKTKNIFLTAISALFIFAACTEEKIIDEPGVSGKGDLVIELSPSSRIHKRDVPGPQVNQFDAFKAYFDAMSSGNEPCQKERFQ